MTTSITATHGAGPVLRTRDPGETSPHDAPGHATPADAPGHASRAHGSGQIRRAELAAFLRSRRERISPEDVGLPPGLRRRTAGLRREEVAQLAGVGVTWYTWLEQGRPINASVQVLGAVARTLRLDQPEREHLYRLADIPDAASAAGAAAESCPQVAPEVQGILDSLSPLPASVLNERFDLLAWNKPYAAMWPGVVGAAPGERNTLWMCFNYPDCCNPYVNRAEQLSTLVAQLRGAYGRHVGEPTWTGFVRRLQAVSPHFAQLWAEQDVASATTYMKIFRHPAHPRLAMTTTSLAVLAAPGTRIIVYTPVDETTRIAVGQLLAGQGADARYPCWTQHRGLAGPASLR
ncbi:MAG TPA: helix-turn-helix transcriptional regulator [Streptosporangiaceae bacterium]|nr:helix-turn-helix transcriptional regulator [Streptosporangiaceae bacterium]